MRNYWLKIAASALGIFAVGMVIITTARSVKNKVTSAINSSDPISLPLIGMVPFQLDSYRLGSLSRLEFLRSDPQHVSGVRVVVKLDNPMAAERLRSCVIALDNVDNIGERTTFRCQPKEVAAVGLEQFGTVVVRGVGDSFPLLLPAKAIADLRATSFHVGRQGIQITTAGDRRRRLLEERTDSMREALTDRIEARSDSADQLRDLADELEDSASAAPPAERRAIQRRADSTRTAMRAVIDRLKADEARLGAFEELHHLSRAEIDSLAGMGQRIADSVHRVVAQELQRVQAELEAAQAAREAPRTPSATVNVEAPAPPIPPAPPR